MLMKNNHNYFIHKLQEMQNN